MSAESDRLLDIDDLNVWLPAPDGEPLAVLRNIGFQLGREKLGIVGESGSGKSMTARAILRLLPPGADCRAARLAFNGQDLAALSPAGMRRLRGRQIAMVLQDPRFALNPVMRVGTQIAEAFRIHHAGRRTARAQALAMLEAVEIRDPQHVYRAYPHALSGGMGQRIMLAMMLAGDPQLLIADEPTSALDVTIERQILALLDDLVSRRRMGLIFISHDLDLVASFCDRVLVMYGGRIVETCAADKLHLARHPYTRALLGAAPRLDQPRATLPTLDRDPAWLAP